MKIMRSVIAALLAFITVSATAAQKDTLKVLAIGNSFSMDSVEQNLFEIAEADGTIMVIGNMYIGGCSLERHYNNSKTDNKDYSYRKIAGDGKLKNLGAYTLEQALKDEKWDIVTLQQASHFSGKYETYEPYMSKLVKYVKKYAGKNVRIMWHQTWAYAKGATHGSFPNYGKSQSTMYKAIMEASKANCDKYKIEVIPCGTTIQNIRTSYDRDNCNRDGFHLNRMGRYAAACTWYEAITGKSVVNNSYSPEYLYPRRAALARAAAHAAVQKPFEVTKAVEFGYGPVTKNEDENLVKPYTLPDALTMNDGTPVTNAQEWMEKRRPELLAMFESEMYGKAPGRPSDEHFEVVSTDYNALNGIAIRKEVKVYFTKGNKRYMTVLMYLPKRAKGPSPVFVGLNFMGNEGVSDDPGVTIDKRRIAGYGVNERPEGRGIQSNRWPLDQIINHGYGVVTWCREDVDPDYDDSFQNGVQPLFYKKGQKFPAADEWGTIAAWSWSISRAIDYLETDKDVDCKRIISIGHSRLGKSSLWAAAVDTRIAMCVSNDSGCGGAALSRRVFGENVKMINHSFPYWFCANFEKYNDNEAALPFDQHELIALIAPRPICVASASFDLHADPKGEYLATREASKVYQLFGFNGIAGTEMPEPGNVLAGDHVCYHLRDGKHNILSYDWEQYINFADKYLKK